jgi:uncharacterized protein (TIGR02588 family)
MKKPKKNPLEWTVFAVSALLVLALLAVLIHAVLDRTPGPAELRIELGPPEARGGRYMVPVHVRNEGGRTAEEVKVEVVLRSGETEVEKADLVLRFVPAQSDREGWVAFGRDPACCELAARPVGFESP